MVQQMIGQVLLVLLEDAGGTSSTCVLPPPPPLSIKVPWYDGLPATSALRNYSNGHQHSSTIYTGNDADELAPFLPSYKGYRMNTPDEYKNGYRVLYSASKPTYKGPWSPAYAAWQVWPGHPVDTATSNTPPVWGNWILPVRDSKGFSYGSPTPGNTSHADTVAWGQIRPSFPSWITDYKAAMARQESYLIHPTIASWFDCYYKGGVTDPHGSGQLWAGSHIQPGRNQINVGGFYKPTAGGDDTNGWWPLNTYGTSAYVAATHIDNVNSLDNQARWLWENVFRWHCCTDPSKQLFSPDPTYQNPLNTLMISNENDNRSQGPTIASIAKQAPCWDVTTCHPPQSSGLSPKQVQVEHQL